MKALEISLLSSPYTTVKLKWTGLPYRSYSFLCLHIVSLSKFEDLIWHTVVFSFIDAFFSFFGVLTGQKGFQRGELRETGVIAGSTNFSSNKRLLRHQSSKTSRVFLKDVMELKHESITLSSLVRRAAPPNLLNLNLFFPRRWQRPRSRLSPFPLPPCPGYLKVPNVGGGGGNFSLGILISLANYPSNNLQERCLFFPSVSKTCLRLRRSLQITYSR